MVPTFGESTHAYNTPTQSSWYVGTWIHWEMLDWLTGHGYVLTDIGNTLMQGGPTAWKKCVHSHKSIVTPNICADYRMVQVDNLPEFEQKYVLLFGWTTLYHIHSSHVDCSNHPHDLPIAVSKSLHSALALAVCSFPHPTTLDGDMEHEGMEEAVEQTSQCLPTVIMFELIAFFPSLSLSLTRQGAFLHWVAQVQGTSKRPLPGCGNASDIRRVETEVVSNSRN